MAKITISMPDALDEYVAGQVEAGGFSDAGQYLQELVRRDRKRREAEAELRRILEDAEASGVSDRTVPEIMQQVEEKLRAEGRL